MNAREARGRGSSNAGRDEVNARAGVKGEVNSDREMRKKERVGGRLGGEGGCDQRQRSATTAGGTR